MVIGIHAKALDAPQPTGVETYVEHLIRHLVMLPESQEHHFRLYTASQTVARRKHRDAWEGIGPRVEFRVIDAPLLWTQVRLAWELSRRPPDVYFSPVHALPRRLPSPTVATIHGLEFERRPDCYPTWELAYLRGVTRDAAGRATRLIAVSEATKKDLGELYRVPQEKITVIQHGAPPRDVTGAPAREGRGSPNAFRQAPAPYFLYLGRIEKKKNVDGIIRSYLGAKERYRLPHKLVLAGKDAYGAGAIRRLARTGPARDDIIFSGYVSAEQRRELLAGATALLLPSWYEGFGIPILEGQAAGVPVITANVSAMPEVGGRGAIYVDPSKTQELAEALRRVAGDQQLRDRLIGEGLRNLARFNWTTCARKTLAVLTAAA